MKEFKLNKKSLEMQEFNLKIQLQGINLQNLKEKRQRDLQKIVWVIPLSKTH